MNYVPKIAAIHDISGVGRCSMTVVSPILSALGCQVCPLPTALLSSHSEYKDFYFYDFTEHLKPYYDSWERNNVKFDCLYSGFIGSEKQINIIIDIINSIKSNNKALVVVDPVMGDHGIVYKTYTDKMVEKMSDLVESADIITPNLTETCIILKEKYSSDNISLDILKSYLKRLSDLGPNTVLITGVKIDTEEHVNVAFDKVKNEYYKIPYNNINVRFPGTGDLFTSLFIGYLFNGKNTPQAIQEATRFVSSVVSFTHDAKTPTYEGVLFESKMKELYSTIENYNYYNI